MECMELLMKKYRIREHFYSFSNRHRRIRDVYDALEGFRNKTKMCVSEASEGWSFIYVSGGTDNRSLKTAVRRVLSEFSDSDNFEVIIVGPRTCMELGKHPRIRYILFREWNLLPGWITKKKNIGAAAAKYDKCMIAHDYIAIEKGWKAGMEAFGDDFDICMNKIRLQNGRRFRDWMVWDYPQIGPALLPYDKECTQYQYISGAFFLVKKEFFLENRLDETLRWNEAEDIEWSKRVRLKTVFKMNPLCSVRLLKPKTEGGAPYCEEWVRNTQKLSELLGGGILILAVFVNKNAGAVMGNNIKQKIRIFLNKKGWRIFYAGKEDFFTYWVRPKASADCIPAKSLAQEPDCAIVVQGGLVLDDHFTLETVKLYKKLFPKSPVILSSWKGEDRKELAAARRAGAKVCLSVHPENPGPNNENRQRISSMAGIRAAQKMGCRYVLKTRTDQRMYAADILTFFKELLEEFPVCIRTKAEKRIVSSSLSTFDNRLYNISDMLVFGTVKDMKKYFGAPEKKGEGQDVPYDQEEYSRLRNGEIYFASHYIEACGHRLLWTIEDSDYYRDELFIIIDAEAADLYWPKYTEMEYRWRRYQPSLLHQVTFRDWFLGYRRSARSCK